MQHQGFAGYVHALGLIADDVDSSEHAAWGDVHGRLVENALRALAPAESGKRADLQSALDYCKAATAGQAEKLVRNKLFIAFATAITVGRVFPEVEVDVCGTPELVNFSCLWRIGEAKTDTEGARAPRSNLLACQVVVVSTCVLLTVVSE